MSFILKTIRHIENDFGQILDPLGTKDYFSMTLEKYRLF